VLIDEFDDLLEGGSSKKSLNRMSKMNSVDSSKKIGSKKSNHSKRDDEAHFIEDRH
jgi:hypothetical protein